MNPPSDVPSTDLSTALNTVQWNQDGLVAAIAQDATSNKILMMAWMNRDALTASIEQGEAVYWSRSKQRLWHKGESSGHTQKIISIRLDCDADTVLLFVEQHGGIACHTGRESCMFREFDAQSTSWIEIDSPLKDPADIYG